MFPSVKIAASAEAREGIGVHVGTEVREVTVRREIGVREGIEGHVEIVRREIGVRARRVEIGPRATARREIEVRVLQDLWAIGPRVRREQSGQRTARRLRVPLPPARPPRLRRRPRQPHRKPGLLRASRGETSHVTGTVTF
jgi:hypothetical protein